MIIAAVVVYVLGGCFTFGTLIETEDAGPSFFLSVFWPIVWAVALGAAFAKEVRK